MKTIDLEKELLKSKQPILSTNDKFVIEEVEALGAMEKEHLDVYARLGMDKLFKAKKDVESKIDTNIKFPKERLFTIEEIEKICLDYGLRFLATSQYKGALCPKLPEKVLAFEQKYNLTVVPGDTWFSNDKKDSSVRSFIAAPKQSFELIDRTKDPLFFVEIGDGFYYLLHKWGNDISARRKMLFAPVRTPAMFILINLLISIVIFGVVKLTGILPPAKWSNDAEGFDVFLIFMHILLPIVLIIASVVVGYNYATKTNWRSNIK